MDAITPPSIKERPIIFSAAMVRAILEGRKTQTRRIIKPQPISVERCRELTGSGYHFFPRTDWGKPDVFSIAGPVGTVLEKSGIKNHHKFKCPYGRPGDPLWVREAMCSDGDDWWFPADGAGGEFNFPITGNDSDDDFTPQVLEWMDKQHAARRVTVPSIHMPRWASRILLEVVSVRVERLHSMKLEDYEAEGYLTKPTDVVEAVAGWEALWDSLHGKGAFDANPWVWVIEFKRVDA